MPTCDSAGRVGSARWPGAMAGCDGRAAEPVRARRTGGRHPSHDATRRSPADHGRAETGPRATAAALSALEPSGRVLGVQLRARPTRDGGDQRGSDVVSPRWAPWNGQPSGRAGPARIEPWGGPGAVPETARRGVVMRVRIAGRSPRGRAGERSLGGTRKRPVSRLGLRGPGAGAGYEWAARPPDQGGRRPAPAGAVAGRTSRAVSRPRPPHRACGRRRATPPRST